MNMWTRRNIRLVGGEVGERIKTGKVREGKGVRGILIRMKWKL